MLSYIILIHSVHLALWTIKLLGRLIQVLYLILDDMTIRVSLVKRWIYLALGSRLNAVVKFCKALALSPFALYIRPNMKYGFALSGDASFSLINSRSAACEVSSIQEGLYIKILQMYIHPRQLVTSGDVCRISG
jgi:hypothetical protein